MKNGEPRDIYAFQFLFRSINSIISTLCFGTSEISSVDCVRIKRKIKMIISNFYGCAPDTNLVTRIKSHLKPTEAKGCVHVAMCVITAQSCISSRKMIESHFCGSSTIKMSAQCMTSYDQSNCNNSVANSRIFIKHQNRQQYGGVYV